MNKSLSLQEFIDLDELQAIQDSFAETTGISSVFLSPEGKPLTRLTNPTGFCSLIRSTEEGKRRCALSFIEMSKKALEFKEPQIFYCFAYGGHFVVPIIINGEHKATMFAGQFIPQSFSASQLEELKKIAVAINVDPVQLIEKANQMRVIDKDVIRNNANFMFQIVKVITRLGMQAGELQQAKDALQKAHIKLEVRVRQRTTELVKSNEELNQEIIERKQVEERIEHLNSVLKAIRDVNQLIMEEKDRDRLLQKACDILIEARGYDAAWFGFLSGGETFATVKGSGFREGVARFCEHVISGDYPSCIKKALAQKEKYVVADSSRECENCIFKSTCAGKEAAIIRVEYSNRLYGLLAILFAPDVTADEEEKGLLNEVAGDISFALHDMEVEESRKQAEEALLQSEIKYRTLVEQIPAITYIAALDESSTTLYVSPQIETILGISPADYKTDPDFWVKHIHPDDRERVMDEIRRCHESDQPFILEYRMVSKDGRLVWFSDDALIVRDEKGKPLHLQGIMYDITERKKVEQELRESEEKIRTLYDSSSDAIMLLDEKGFFDCNDMTLRLFGCASREEFCSRHPGDFSPPTQPDGTDSMSYARNNIAVALKKGSKRFEHLHRRLDGTDFPAEVLLDALMLGGKKVLQARVYDITERKSALEAIRESERRYKTLFEVAMDGILIAEVETKRFKYANPALCKMLGYSIEELEGLSISDIHPKDKLEYIISEFGAQARGEKTLAQDIPCLRKDGTIIYADINTTAALVDGKKCNIGLFRDITEYKQADEALAAEANRRRILMEQSRDGIVVLNQDGSVVESNNRFAEMLGYSPKEVSHLHVWDWEFQFTREQVLDMIRNVDDAGDAFETQHSRKDGTIYDVEISTNGAVFAGEKLIFCVCRDITERKQAEEMLKNKQKMEAAYTDMLTISNKTLDLHTIITEGLDSLMKYTDAQAGAVYLYDPDSKMMVPNTITGMEKTVTVKEFSPGEGIVGEAAQTQEMIVLTSIPEDTIYTIKSGSNHIIPVTIISTPMIFKGTLLGVVVTCHSTNIPHDVLIFIKRIIDQYALALNNANTFIQVQDMAASLKNQRDELEIKSHELEATSRAKSEFLANMSHELRTPLNSIIGFSEVLHDGTFGPLNEKQTKYISNVLISGKHLLELINGILDLAKVEAGKMERICEDFNVSEVFDESMMLLSSVALKKNIVLSAAVDKELTALHADVGKFKQILYNLMSNAIKFTPKGGSVTVEAHRSGDMAHIAVSDTGIGISKEEQDKLFQPFMQVDASASRQYQGTGLGLSLVKRFVEMHGGRVWVESEPDRGSTFTFTMPIKKD